MIEVLFAGGGITGTLPQQFARPRKRAAPPPMVMFFVASAVFWLAAWWIVRRA